MTKTINNYFNISRFFKIFRIDLMVSMKMYLFAIGALSGIIIVFNILSIKDQADPEIILELFLIIGVITSSYSFSLLNKQEESITYLLIPASTEEKFLSKFLISFVCYFLVSIIVSIIHILFIDIIQSLYFNEKLNLNNLLDSNYVYWSFFIYMFFHSIYFLGSIFFSKLNFLKTSLAINVITILLAGLGFLFFFLLFFSEIMSGDLQKIGSIKVDIIQPFGNTLPIIFWILFYSFPVILYIVSYLKLKEYEVR